MGCVVGVVAQVSALGHVGVERWLWGFWKGLGGEVAGTWRYEVAFVAYSYLLLAGTCGTVEVGISLRLPNSI